MPENHCSNSEQQQAELASQTMHKADACAQMLGIQILEIRPGHAVLTMNVTDQMINGFQICHGGMITTLADTAFAHACNSHNRLTVAQSLSVEFVRSARLGDKLTAVASELNRNRKTGVYDVTVTNQGDQLVALFRGKSYELGQLIHPPNG